jgi:hypothetical protein
MRTLESDFGRIAVVTPWRSITLKPAGRLSGTASRVLGPSIRPGVPAHGRAGLIGLSARCRWRSPGHCWHLESPGMNASCGTAPWNGVSGGRRSAKRSPSSERSGFLSVRRSSAGARRRVDALRNCASPLRRLVPRPEKGVRGGKRTSWCIGVLVDGNALNHRVRCAAGPTKEGRVKGGVLPTGSHRAPLFR